MSEPLSHVVRFQNKIDFPIVKGLTFAKTLTWSNSDKTPVDITGYTITMSIRTKPGIGQGTELKFVDVDLTDPENGVFTINIPAQDTANINWTVGYYNILANSPDIVPIVTRLLFGSIVLDE